MAGKSNIEWTGHTWNPIAGCSVLSPGCTNCYAMKMAQRLAAMGQELYRGTTKPTKAGPVWTGVMRQASREVLLTPIKRKKPTTYFVNSMSDLFHENVPDEWIEQIFAVMALSGQHTFQVLTKRADRMRETVVRLGKSIETLERHAREFGWTLKFEGTGLVPWPLRNVWLGVSTEDQRRADERIPQLLQAPAAVRFISAEPLIGPLDISDYLVETACTNWPDYLDWVIVGGESGPGARVMNPEWAEALRDQCKAGRTSFFMKQMWRKGPIPDALLVRQMPRAA